jgi:hypothetical protein
MGVFLNLIMIPIVSAAPLACERSGSLNATQSGVLSDSNSFIYEGEQYDFQVFSITDKNPSAPSSWCIRYEVLNLGKRKIQNFLWHDINFNKDILPAEQSKPWIIKETVIDFDRPTPVRSVVTAFNGTKSSIRALFTRYPAYDKKLSSAQNYSFKYFDVSKSIPDSEAVLRNANFRVLPAASVAHADMQIDFLPLFSELESGDVRIKVSSKASYGKDGYSTVIEIMAKTNDGMPIKFFAPTLETILNMNKEEVFRSTSVDDQVRYFAKNFLALGKSGLAVKDGYFLSKFKFPSGDSLENKLFIIRYPLRVDTKIGSFCINAITYSPIPVSSNGRVCNLEK